MERQNPGSTTFDFAELWLESLRRLAPKRFLGALDLFPEALRRARTAWFQSQASAWDQYLRSPAFLEAMRQFLSHTIALRRVTNDWLARVRGEFQGVSREDIGAVLLSVRHLEKRMLDRIEELGFSSRNRSGADLPRPPQRPRRPRSRRNSRFGAAPKP